MCGIVGWLSRAPGRPVDSGILRRMRDEMTHRGPDDQGMWVSTDRSVGLAFRRLSIVDLSASAGQPMPNEDESVWIVFNGEIYNHRDLRRELETRGHRFRTDHSDTEVVVHGYEEWGGAVVEQLDGMFALAIWDCRSASLFLARDRIGVKPLYMTWCGSHFLFASEIKALLLHPEVRAEVEPFGLYHYLSFLTTPAPLTMFRGIFKLPAGHRVTIGADSAVTADRYWDLPAESGELARMSAMSDSELEGYAVERTADLLSKAVEKRLMSDVPFGVFLSGGLDSSAITALMARHHDRPVKTYTVGFADHQKHNELQYARRVASYCRSEHHEVLVDEVSMREYLPRLIFSQDEPIADWVCIPLYFVSKLARDTGTRVVLVGEGSDEQFCGYDSYMAYLRLYGRYWAPFRALPGVVTKAAAWLACAGSRVLGRGVKYTDILHRAAHDREHFWGSAISFWEPEKRGVLNRAAIFRAAQPVGHPFQALLPDQFFREDSFGIVSDLLGQFDRRNPPADALARMAYLEFKLRLPELLLMRVDKITMSASIEARVPYLDQKLVELTAALPMSLKVKHRVPKYLLKKSVEGLIPDDVINRKKVGFSAPMREWLRGDFGREAESIVMNSSLRREGYFDYTRIREMFRAHRDGRDLGLKLWTLCNLSAWHERWIGGNRAI